MVKLLDNIPFLVLAPIALLLAIAPVGDQPHLVEKLSMLIAGELSRLIDIVDLCLHAFPLVLLIVKIARKFVAPKQA